MKIPPIPESLLGDTMTVRVPVGGDYGGEYAADAVTVGPVRYESATALKSKGWVLADGSEGIVYMDAVNSHGAFDVPVGSLLTIGGEERIAVKCTPYHDYRAHLHHWELEVK